MMVTTKLPVPLRVALVEDKKIERDELIRQLTAMKSVQLEYAKEDYDSLFEESDSWSFRDYSPHIVLVDLSLGRGKKTGFSVIDRFKKMKESPKIIVVTGDKGEVFLEESENKRVCGVIRKSLLAGEEPKFLENILHKVYLDKSGKCLLFLEENTQIYLTDREKLVLKARLQGLSYDEITEKTGVSKVAIMFQKIRFRLNVSSNESLVLKVEQLRLLE